ncbi:MAG: cytochrome c3 family protein [Gordonibacter sp.]|uniref:cytochrome c3 family protein n=1 Tax=Gordonibacter sp. TaxID=1968902 RepID=UPI002FC8DA68
MDDPTTPVIEQENAGAAPASQPTPKKKRKGLIALGIAAVIIVGVGAGFWVWHEQPSFCNAICHTPMDPYVEDYYSSNTTLLATAHRVSEVSCLDCHVPTLSEQVAEGAAWVSGGYAIPLEQRTYDSSFCATKACHNVGWDSLEKITASFEYNPHSNYHEELSCGDCHKSHTESVMQCAQCHNDAKIPVGWAAS